MTDDPCQASEIEGHIASLMENRNIGKDTILRLVGDLSATDRFVMKDRWLELSRSSLVEDWCRLEAYKLLINRCLNYPCHFDDFVREAITPLGIAKSQLVDMTMGQVLPIERNQSDLILMLNLPIKTPIGPASLYVAVCRSTNMVKRTVVYPNDVEGYT